MYKNLIKNFFGQSSFFFLSTRYVVDRTATNVNRRMGGDFAVTFMQWHINKWYKVRFLSANFCLTFLMCKQWTDKDPPEVTTYEWKGNRQIFTIQRELDFQTRTFDGQLQLNAFDNLPLKLTWTVQEVFVTEKRQEQHLNGWQFVLDNERLTLTFKVLRNLSE